MSEVSTIYLSKQLQGIISHRGSHLKVIACAGAGKTEAMAQRVASLVVEGVQPTEIVAFTFTERAAESLKARILARVADRTEPEFADRAGAMFVGTIHAYCLRLLQLHVPQYGNYDVLDEHGLAGLLSREHDRLHLEKLAEKHWESVRDFLRNAAVVENELIDPKALRSPFRECYEAYLDRLRDYRLLPYGLIIAEAVRVLEEKPEVFGRVHGNLKQLIVDEYQDINPAQERLIQRLAEPPVCLCVVGDDDQAIYQWRGSSVENMLTFEDRYADTKVFRLVENRRSLPKIVRAANKFAQTVKPRLRKAMKTTRKGTGPQLCSWSAETPKDEAQVVATTIERLLQQGYRPGDIGILLRSVRTSSRPIIDALRMHGIPFRCSGRTGLFWQDEPQLLGKTYAWLAGTEWKESPFGQPEGTDLETLEREYRTLFGLPPQSARRLKGHFQAWRANAQDARTPANLLRDYYLLLRGLRVHEWDLGDREKAARMGSLARFAKLLADFEHVSRRARPMPGKAQRGYGGGQNRGNWYYKRLFYYLQYYALAAYEGAEGEEDPDLDAVDIATVHQAKGLEWRVVFVPCLVTQRFPSAKTGTKPKRGWRAPRRLFSAKARRRYEGSEADERRLFYVAMTRARDMLYLSRFQRYDAKSAGLSPFLNAVAGKDPRLVKGLPLPPAPIDVPGAEAAKPTLSFSDLALYETCPMSYRLSHLIGFQPPLVEEVGYGKAIHHILREVADHVKTHHRKPSQQQLEDLFEEFYLPYADQATYGPLLNSAKKLVNSYLRSHRDDLRRVWETERPVELHLGAGIVTGRADVVLDEEGGRQGTMALVDYKTARDSTSHDLYQFQLRVYAAAAQDEGLNVAGAYLHYLAQRKRCPVEVGGRETAEAKKRANELLEGLAVRDFRPRPAKGKCSQCDVRLVCPHGPGR